MPRNKVFQQNSKILQFTIFASHLCVKNSPKRNLNNGHLEISGPASQHQHWHCIFFVSFASRFFFVEKIEHLCCVLWLVSQDHYQFAKIIFPTISYFLRSLNTNWWSRKAVWILGTAHRFFEKIANPNIFESLSVKHLWWSLC